VLDPPAQDTSNDVGTCFPLGPRISNPGVASLNRCKFAGGLWFPGSSLGGGDLLVEGVAVELLVFDSVEVLAVDVGERRAV
jgi:hypothetical protein